MTDSLHASLRRCRVTHKSLKTNFRQIALTGWGHGVGLPTRQILPVLLTLGAVAHHDILQLLLLLEQDWKSIDVPWVVNLQRGNLLHPACESVHYSHSHLKNQRDAALTVWQRDASHIVINEQALHPFIASQ
jgi:hypothetical protein